jgi:hypothetical protein
MARGARTGKSETTWVVYLLGGKRAERLGTIRAPDRDAAIAKAIEFFGIADPEWQKRVAVSQRPMPRSARGAVKWWLKVFHFYQQQLGTRRALCKMVPWH